MAKMEYTWPAESFDAIGIRARDVNINVKGIDGDEARLEVNGDKKRLSKLQVDLLGYWLWISAPASSRDLRFTLLLPEKKVWLIDLYAHNTNFHAENTRARLNLILGKGEVQLKNCSGAFSLASGTAKVLLKCFSEEEVPEMPPLPDSERKGRKSAGIYMSWGKDDWSQWGLEFSEKMLIGFLGQSGGTGQHHGINVKIGKGDLQIEEIEATSFIVRSARSTVKMKEVCAANLDLKIIKGDIESRACTPGDDWKIRTHYGNITLSFSMDIDARLDATTRFGNIRSVTPLVRVTRQGPGSGHGGRMVGIIGSTPDKKQKIPEIRVSTLRGDIIIEAKQPASRFSEKPAPPESPPPPPPSIVDSYQTNIAVLEALSEGRITVSEAEKILDSLESREKAT